jgi:hypothetical protein
MHQRAGAADGHITGDDQALRIDIAVGKGQVTAQVAAPKRAAT